MVHFDGSNDQMPTSNINRIETFVQRQSDLRKKTNTIRKLPQITDRQVHVDFREMPYVKGGIKEESTFRSPMIIDRQLKSYK